MLSALGGLSKASPRAQSLEELRVHGSSCLGRLLRRRPSPSPFAALHRLHRLTPLYASPSLLIRQRRARVALMVVSHVLQLVCTADTKFSLV